MLGDIEREHSMGYIINNKILSNINYIQENQATSNVLIYHSV